MFRLLAKIGLPTVLLAWTATTMTAAPARLLRPMAGERLEAGESIYAPVPVSLSVELDARGRVKSIAGDTPTPAAVTDAARYIKTLRDSGHPQAGRPIIPSFRGKTEIKTAR